MRSSAMPIRWIVPAAVVGSLLTMCALGVREARSAGGGEGDDIEFPLESDDLDGETDSDPPIAWDTDTDTGETDTDTDAGDTDTDTVSEDTGDVEDTGDTAVPSAADLAGEVGGFHCSVTAASPWAAWPLLLGVLGLLARGRRR